MNDFIKSTDDYRSYINEQRATFKILGEKMRKLDFAQSLLYWMSWSHVTTDDAATQNWQLTGDPKVIFDRPTHDAFLSNKKSDCQVRPSTTFNPSTGKFKITFNSTELKNSSICTSILKTSYLLFDSMSETTTFDIKWDTASHITASAINSGVSVLSLFHKLYFLPEI